MHSLTLMFLTNHLSCRNSKVARQNYGSFLSESESLWTRYINRASAFQQFDILTGVDSDKPLQPPVKLRNSK